MLVVLVTDACGIDVKYYLKQRYLAIILFCLVLVMGRVYGRKSILMGFYVFMLIRVTLFWNKT